jgi:hypothetical protein
MAVRAMAAALVLMAIAGGAAAQTQAPVVCGEPYVVRRGDTLQRIAVRAYGPEASFRDLLAPNAELFARVDPSLIEPGMTLNVPCRDAGPAQAPAAAAVVLPPPPAGAVILAAPPPAPPAPVAAPAQATVAAPPAAPVAPRALRIAAASAEVGDPALPRAMAREALARRGDDLRVDAIEDRAAHLGPLLGEGLYAASLPWLMPDCAAADLTAEAARLCADAVWSAPLAEVAVSTLTRETPGGGSGLCAQAGLAALAGAGARLEEDAAACVAALLDGAVATALVEARAADAAIAALGAAGALREDMAAFRVATLHAVALAGSADGAAALAALDAGLAAD